MAVAISGARTATLIFDYFEVRLSVLRTLADRMSALS
jgi:hypothetical protein